jgi:hypothetical protein
MQYLEAAYIGRLRMLNWKSGDTGPRVTQTKPSSLLQSLMKLKEDAKNG